MRKKNKTNIRLTIKQVEIFRLWAEGHYPPEIAQQLNTSNQYVYEVLDLVRKKLGVDMHSIRFFREYNKKRRAERKWIDNYLKSRGINTDYMSENV